ncbi:MAG: hypothetical protein IPN92_16720 [Chromatiaceae bacterium]|nr:hypothetical protein [Chromatiaceae bacterium]
MDINNNDQAHAVRGLWCALQRTSEHGLVPKAVPAARLADIVRQGGAAGWQIEDLLIDLGAPWEISARWPEMARLAEAPVQCLRWRPSGRSNRASGVDGLTLADLAGFVIRLESWGLPVDPTELVAAILPTVKTKKLLTDRELRAYWWTSERHRLRDLLRFAAPIPEKDRGVLTLPSGYRAAAHADGLVIAGPKFGKRRWADALLSLDVDNATAATAASTGI